MGACPFCRIVQGEDSATVVFESDTALAFFPLRPAARGHTLVVPKAHVSDFLHVDEAQASDLTGAVLRVARAVERAVAPDGMNVLTSAGEAATQTVFHLHVHVLPRWHDDPIGTFWPDEAVAEGAALAEVAAAVRQSLSD